VKDIVISKLGDATNNLISVCP